LTPLQRLTNIRKVLLQPVLPSKQILQAQELRRFSLKTRISSAATNKEKRKSVENQKNCPNILGEIQKKIHVVNKRMLNK
jgi:hypothetical protein